ncbi:hypothetical protein KAU39_05705 [bacterium]|nr:hypothetical protein [bacterium]
MKKTKEAVMNKFKKLGKMKLKTVILLLTFISVGYLMLVVSLYAAVPQRINYQGKLLDNLGAPVSDEDRDITFSIFNVSTLGAALWSETQSVSTQYGLFNVILGSVAAISLDFNQDYWLEVQVSGDGAMTPRHKLVSTPYSFRAEDANNSEQLNSQSAGYYLDASNINAGTLSDSRLSSSVSLLGSSIDASEITTNIVSSVDGVTNDGGNIDLVAGSNISILPNDGANNITISASMSGDNLGNHTATQNINLNGNYLSGDGGSEGIYVTNDGIVGIGITTPVNCVLHLYNNSDKWHTLRSTNENTDSFNIAINGIASGSGAAVNFGVWGSASATSGTNYAVYGTATNGATNWAGYFSDGNVHIANNLWVGTTSPAVSRKLWVSGDAGGTTAWSNDSHSSYKEKFKEVSVLDKIKNLNIMEWQYKKEHCLQDTYRHLSPFAEDFKDKFGLGKSEREIQALDVAGVALKAVQEQQITIEELRKEVLLLKERMKK